MKGITFFELDGFNDTNKEKKAKTSFLCFFWANSGTFSNILEPILEPASISYFFSKWVKNLVKKVYILNTSLDNV